MLDHTFFLSGQARLLNATYKKEYFFRSSVWVAPKENPLDFQYFRKNFLDFKDEYHYCYNSSEYNQEKVRSVKNSKKKVSYADTNKYLSLGFRVL